MLLEAFYTNNRITDCVAEKAKVQYSLLCSEAHSNLEGNFKTILENGCSSKRVDDFFSSILLGNQSYTELWQVIKLSLIFSHGNATVESGFSINKTLLVENLHEQSLVAQRRVENAIRHYECIQKVPITHAMLMNVKVARRRYEEYLQESRQNVKQEERKTVEKRKLTLDIKKLEEQKKMLKQQSLKEEEAINTKIQMLKKKKIN